MVYLTSNGTWTYWKVKANGAMSSENIARTCEGGGLLIPCYRKAGHSQNDERCEITFEAQSLSVQLPQVLSKLICRHNTPSSCPSLDGTFPYMANFDDGNSCGVYNGKWCAFGKSFSNLWAICVSRNGKKLVYNLFLFK